MTLQTEFEFALPRGYVDKDGNIQKYEHVLQHNQSDWEFLLERARRIGFVAADGKTLSFRRAPPDAGPIELKWGETLNSLRLRQSAGGQVKEVIVRGWDARNKKEITGKASNPKNLPHRHQHRRPREPRPGQGALPSKGFT